MKNLVFVITCLLWLGFSPLMSAPTKLRFSHITNKDGLPSNTVFSITQDYKGYYWFGTKVGLCRYDGRSIPFAKRTRFLAIRSIVEPKGWSLTR